MAIHNDKLESSAVKELMTRLTGAPYEVSEPPNNFHGRPRWFVWCPDLYYASKSAHVWAIWLGYDNNLRLESADFGNTSNWVEWSYGEEGAIKSMKFDYRYSAEEVVRNVLAREFPIVGQRLKQWDQIIAKVSLEKRVGLGLIFEGTERMAWFKIGAVVAWKPDWRSNEESIEGAAKALKETYDLVNSTRNSSDT